MSQTYLLTTKPFNLALHVTLEVLKAQTRSLRNFQKREKRKKRKTVFTFKKINNLTNKKNIFLNN